MGECGYKKEKRVVKKNVNKLSELGFLRLSEFGFYGDFLDDRIFGGLNLDLRDLREVDKKSRSNFFMKILYFFRLLSI